MKDMGWHPGFFLTERADTNDLSGGSTKTIFTIQVPPPPMSLPITDQDSIRLQNQQGSTLAPTWIMKKCLSSQPASHWQPPSTWTSSGSHLAAVIKTCDVVALWIVSVGLVQDCAGSHCTQQPYPPPAGHWGTAYKPRIEGQGCGVVITAGASVYFERMKDMGWHPGFFLTERAKDLSGGSTKTIFTIQVPPPPMSLPITDQDSIRLQNQQGSTLAPTWIMKKCLSSQPASHWQPPSTWTSPGSHLAAVIKTCDVVALWIVSD